MEDWKDGRMEWLNCFIVKLLDAGMKDGRMGNRNGKIVGCGVEH